MLIEAGLIGMAAKSSSDYTSFKGEYDTQLANYNLATVPSEIASYKALVDQARTDMDGANEQLVLFSSAAAGIWVLNALHAVLTGPKIADSGEKKSPVRLAFDPVTSQTKIEWRLNL